MLGTLLVLYMISYRVLIEPLWGGKLLQKNNHQLSPKIIYPNEKENVDILADIRSSIIVWLLITSYKDM